ncbi:hypothetical protein EG328_006648 [Venturia inaequalis]|uniref:Uncharacterized protein n=1 Tax=Venturia inaequalis TaxID=5025 RepID=A0A8H3UI83_VENIN|nr:hypothetical protein EG328_006648 [Venturia inaequalis]
MYRVSDPYPGRGKYTTRVSGTFITFDNSDDLLPSRNVSPQRYLLLYNQLPALVQISRQREGSGSGSQSKITGPRRLGALTGSASTFKTRRILMNSVKKGVATATIEPTSAWDAKFAENIDYSIKQLIFGRNFHLQRLDTAA